MFHLFLQTMDKMKFSQKCNYALRVMLDLSTFYHYRRAHISDLAERRDIPPKFLGQILLLLKKKGLVKSKKGPSGGYTLKRPPSEIMVGEVIRVVEKSFFSEDPDSADTQKESRDYSKHGFYGLLRGIDEAVHSVIDHISFEDIRKREAERYAQDTAGNTFVI